jgi:DNA-binding beta-propeller fold protein YncE
VAVSRAPAAQVVASIAMGGRAEAIALDPVVGEAFIATCSGCDREPAEDGQVIEVIDMATRNQVAQIPIPALHPRLAADPYASALFVSHTGTRGEKITVIDTTSHDVTGAIDVAAWAITVDPTTGTLYALAEAEDGEQLTAVAVVDVASGDVLARIEVGVDAMGGLAVDPVRARLLVGDPGHGRIVVVDLASRTVARTIHVVPGMDDPCENCLGYLSAPVVDLTTGLVYVAGPPSVAAADANPGNALAVGDGHIGPAGLASGASGVRPIGGGGSSVFVVDASAGEVVANVPAPGWAIGAWAHDPAAGVVYLSTVGGVASGVVPLDVESLALGGTIQVAVDSPGPLLAALDPTTGEVWAAQEYTSAVLR